MNLNQLKQGEQEIVITETCAVTVIRHARGATATVTDAGSRFDGEYAFASTPDIALWSLKNKLSALKEDVVI